MNDREEPVARNESLTELFSALRDVVAENPHIQEMIRLQEQDNRQVLLNMSSVLRMVEQHVGNDEGEADFEASAVPGWLGAGEAEIDTDIPEINADLPARTASPLPEISLDEGVPEAGVDGDEAGRMNFFDRAFLKSLKISL